MERENGKLQRHCQTLQGQVERIGREGEERVQRRRITELKAELAKMGQEKRRVREMHELWGKLTILDGEIGGTKGK